MAGKKKPKVSTRGGVTVVEVPAAAPRRRSSPRTTKIVKTKGRRRKSGSSSSSMWKSMTGAAGGGFAVGFIEKTWGDKIPALPFIGKKGAIALGAYALRDKAPWVREVGIVAAGLAGYEFGRLGTVSGVVGSVATQL